MQKEFFGYRISFLFKGLKKEGVIPTYSETCPPFATEVPNTSVFVSTENFNELRPLINKTLGFAGKTSRIIGQEYLDGLDIHQTVRNQPDSIVLPILRRHSMHLPGFEIYDKDVATSVLQSTDYADEHIDRCGILIAFKLPRLSSLVWTRVNEDSDKSDIKKVSKSIWGKLGRNAKQVFWDTSRLYESRNQLAFRRINDIGDHDVERYHYLFEVTRPPQKLNNLRTA